MVAKLVIILVIIILVTHHQTTTSTNVIKTEVFRLLKIVMEPGLVSNKNYYNIDFLVGHIGLKSFNSELVDEREIWCLSITGFSTNTLLRKKTVLTAMMI
ncbi:hypothetical protein AAHA92_14660 [Salvia divinorum]|uniref:Uncharacterized protein n=1 Tax=Salvia divinorum TaxID=28513 RepID=A0ABD1HG74_SALDI